ncbi:hypothetical protein LTR27_006332 [Elasticomyces elasticus]|nr:hypothetical protein LTR27_006332 [Elasticomyces elasticus]
MWERLLHWLAIYQQRKLAALAELLEQEGMDLVFGGLDEDLEADQQDILEHATEDRGGSLHLGLSNMRKEAPEHQKRASVPSSISSSTGDLAGSASDHSAVGDAARPHKPSEDDLAISHKSGLLSMLRLRFATTATDFSSAAALPFAVCQKVVEVEALAKQKSAKWNNTTGAKCLRAFATSVSYHHWTITSPGLYACVTCTNQQRPCIAKNAITTAWELLPLVPEARAKNTDCNSAEYYIAPMKGIVGMNVDDISVPRSLWRGEVIHPKSASCLERR